MISMCVQAGGSNFNNGSFGIGIGIDIGMGKFTDDDFNAATGMFIAGFEFGENFSVESHIGASDSDTVSISEYGANAKAVRDLITICPFVLATVRV